MAKQRRKQGFRVTKGGRATHVAGPRRRHPTPFKVLRDMALTADEILVGRRVAGPPEMVDHAMFVRGINCVKSIMVLLENGQWENASGITRQLFELLVNAEHYVGHDDREAAATTYAKYALLQELRSAQAVHGYQERTGRPADPERVAVVDRLLADQFDEFRRKGGDGWATSWSGKTTWELAKESSNSLRRDQYNQLFRVWSEQAHAAPAALIHNLFPGGASPTWVEEVIASDDVHVNELVMMTFVLFSELWNNLPSIKRGIEEQRFAGWAQALREHATAHGYAPAT